MIKNKIILTTIFALSTMLNIPSCIHDMENETDGVELEMSTDSEGEIKFRALGCKKNSYGNYPDHCEWRECFEQICTYFSCDKKAGNSDPPEYDCTYRDVIDYSTMSGGGLT